ncbi:MAG: PD-(D/E)XK nuclease family protein [Bryobacteraceae bacterium]|nr:PD-(D/E)XK nuclease family protein [Bryobacteraceae bacterium]
MGTRTVWLGPPGSGKTTRMLEAVRGHLRAFRDDFRIVVPTATMAEHLRNGLAREGFTLRSGAITTVTGHARELVPGAVRINATSLEMALEEALSANCPPAFAKTREMPGFLKQLAGTLEELINAGCDADTWQGFLSLTIGVKPLLRELGGVWTEVQARLHQRGLLTRHEWLRGAAQALRDGALPGVSTFYWDGFSRLGAAELDLIYAHGVRGGVTVSLPEWRGAARGGLIALRRAGFAIRRFTPVRATPRKVLVKPATEDDEAVEIARRVLEHHRAGRPWHEIGIVVRAKEPYGALLETVFARFGIPVRPYFAQPLEGHPVARLFSSALEALLSGWNWEPSLQAVLSPAGRAGACRVAARFEYAVRKQLPGVGLERLRAMAVAEPDAQPIVDFLDRLARLDAWRSETLTPAAWVARLTELNRLLEPPRLDELGGATIASEPSGPSPTGLRALESPRGSGEPPHITPERISIWRTRAAAAKAWLGAIGETASYLPDQPVSLASLLHAAQPALRDATLRDPEFRRDAVRLIDAQEARQWELPVVFVCGLLEGSFPRAARPDPILGEALRGALRRRQIAVRTRSDRDSEERFLFDVAMTRATSELVLSHPRLNEKGEETLGAFALTHVDGLVEEPVPPCDLAIRPVEAPPAARRYLQSAESLQALAAQHRSFSPTGLETFLECPFQFFAGRTLKLEDPPPAPAERFDALARGTLVHALLAQYHRLHGDLLEMFHKEWERTLAKLRVPLGYRLELDRILIERSLRMYASGAPEHAGWEQHMEENFQLPIAGSQAGPLEVHGRIDRYEVASNNDCVVYDYKFSRPSSVGSIVKDETMGRGLQAGIYLQAVRRKALRPVSFYYVAVKSACEMKGWDSQADLEALMTSAGEQAARAADEILGGRIAVAPIDRDSCTFCSYIDACRIREIGYGANAESESAGGNE